MLHQSHFLTQLGCQLPLIQAPMAGVQGSRLAIAVCQAGGLGSLPCAMLSTSQIEMEIANIRQQTDKPFNVNFFAHQQPELSKSIQQAWFQTLQSYYQEFHLTEQDINYSGGRQPFNKENAELIADLKVPVISFHFGLPTDDLLTIVKQSGAKILSTATTIAEAKFLQSKGVDAIIAQGLEAGGHRGMFLTQDLTTQSGTFSLLPNLKKVVNLPIIAAGGISNNATAQAAFTLGADAIQVGTAFLLADEANTKDFHRKALQSDRAEHTALTNIFSGGFARGIVNRFISEMGGIHKNVPPFPYASIITNPIKNKAEQLGNDEFSSLWAGQNAKLAKAGSAQEIIQYILG